jgi:broad specificity phosphatase PhoE
VARLYLVRHGHAEAGFGESMDPSLDAAGRRQADSVAARLAPLGPLSIMTSPLARARQTAVPLARLWRSEPTIEAAVSEIPSPALNLEERATWLRKFMSGSWRAATPPLAQWREAVIATLASQPEDVVVFSHYIAINVAVGLALNEDGVLVFSPDNCSVTIMETNGNSLRLIEKGAEMAPTKVN